MAQVANIVYLFGAGATHAEFMNLHPKRTTDGNFLDKHSLLLADISMRVCGSAKKKQQFSPQIKPLLSPAGLSNVELFIGLIEKNELKSEATIELLKTLITKDIGAQLTKVRRKRFYLHRALLEIHEKNIREKLLGIISLNYDRVLDEAIEDIYRNSPNYGMHSKDEEGLLLLKLHGGFGLTYNDHILPIMTPGINKNYLELPYNFVWGRALEILIKCDVLRVVGCSLSQNDVGLVDLLFKAHLAKGAPFEIQMITFDPDENKIKEQYGFLPNIKTAMELEGGLEAGMIGEGSIGKESSGSNPFKIWLKAKTYRLIAEKTLTTVEVRKSKYIKKLLK
jgi:hypothetical protein